MKGEHTFGFHNMSLYSGVIDVFLKKDSKNDLIAGELDMAPSI